MNSGKVEARPILLVICANMTDHTKAHKDGVLVGG